MKEGGEVGVGEENMVPARFAGVKLPSLFYPQLLKVFWHVFFLCKVP